MPRNAVARAGEAASEMPACITSSARFLHKNRNRPAPGKQEYRLLYRYRKSYSS